MPKTNVHIPLGYALTITTDAISSGIYVRVAPGEIYTPSALAASTVVVIGPFNEPRGYLIDVDQNMPEQSLAQSGVFTDIDGSAYAPLASPTFTGTASLGSGAKLVLDHGTGTEASNAVTINTQSGVITTSALTTAASGSYLVTMTNSKIVGTGSIIIASIAGGTNTVKDISVEAICTAANTATFTIYNNVLITTALNGTVKINFIVV